MKQVLLSILCLFVLGNLQAQDDQYTIIVKKSADWCPNCGGWAWPVFEEILDKMQDRKAIPILMHHTGGLANDASIAITDNLGGNYQPEFFLDNEIQNVAPSNAADKIASMIEVVDLNASLGAFMGIDINDVYLSSDGTSLSVDLTQEFYGVEGEFSVGVYLIQNNIMHNQAGKGNVLQPKLLTASFTDEPFGVSGMIDGSTVGSVDFTHTLAAPSTLSLADGDTEIVTIIWRWDDDGKKYVFNSDKWSGEISQLSNTNELEEVVSDLTSSFLGNDLIVNLESTESFNDTRISLLTVSGKNIFSDLVNINSGANQFSFEQTELNTGMYILNVLIGDKQITKKLYKN